MNTAKLTIALSKSVTMGSIFEGDPLSIDTEAFGDDPGVGLRTIDGDEESVPSPSGCTFRGSISERLEI